MFQRDLRGLIPKLLSLKAGMVEAKFNESVQSMGPLPTAPLPDILDPSLDSGGPSTAPPPVDEATQVKEPAASYEPMECPVGGSYNESTATSAPTQAAKKFRVYFKEGRDGPRGSDAAAHLQKVMPHAMPQSVFDLVEATSVAEVSPSVAVILAWRAVELEVRALKERLDLDQIRPMQLISSLSAKRVLPWSTRTRYAQLKDLQDAVVHASNFAGSLTDVLQYIERAQELVAALSSVRELP
jgi:hypothetical protein